MTEPITLVFDGEAIDRQMAERDATEQALAAEAHDLQREALCTHEGEWYEDEVCDSTTGPHGIPYMACAECGASLFQIERTIR